MRAAHVILGPSRAEGFGLPIIEGMSSGKPVITTTGLPEALAASDDYVDETVGYPIKGERRPYGHRMIGGLACCGETWWLEPDVKALGRAMREAYNNRDEARKRGEAAAKRVRERYTWDHTVDRMVERLRALAARVEDGETEKRGDGAKLRGGEPGSGRVGDEFAERGGGATGRRGELAAEGHPSHSADPSHGDREGAKADEKPPGEAIAPPRGNTAKPTPGEAGKPNLILTVTDVVDRRSGALASVVRPMAFKRKRPFITLCMIVRQEAGNMPNCLNSVREADCVDAICITDTGSTDGTPEICKEYGAIVSYYDWRDSFSLARNFSFDQAPPETDWRLWMDADDTIPKECGAMVRQSVLLAEARTMGILMQVHIPPRPGEYGYTVVDHLKIVRAGSWNGNPEFRFESRIHEQIMDPITRTGGLEP